MAKQLNYGLFLLTLQSDMYIAKQQAIRGLVITFGRRHLYERTLPYINPGTPSIPRNNVGTPEDSEDIHNEEPCR